MNTSKEVIVYIYAQIVKGKTVYKSTAFPGFDFDSIEPLAKNHLRYYDEERVVPQAKEALDEADARPLTKEEIMEYGKISKSLLEKRKKSQPAHLRN